MGQLEPHSLRDLAVLVLSERRRDPLQVRRPEQLELFAQVRRVPVHPEKLPAELPRARDAEDERHGDQPSRVEHGSAPGGPPPHARPGAEQHRVESEPGQGQHRGHRQARDQAGEPDPGREIRDARAGKAPHRPAQGLGARHPEGGQGEGPEEQPLSSPPLARARDADDRQRQRDPADEERVEALHREHAAALRRERRARRRSGG